jgi:hypothetical protein
MSGRSNINMTRVYTNLQSYMNLVRKCTSYTSGIGARVLEENMTGLASK